MEKDMYEKMISIKLSDALHNMNYCKKEYEQAKNIYETIERQMAEYKKLCGGEYK